MESKRLSRLVGVGMLSVALALTAGASFISAGKIVPPGIEAIAAAYSQSGGVVTQTNQTYTTSQNDQSGVYVSNNGSFYLSDSIISTSGNTSSQDNSSFFGLNAGVLATSTGKIYFTNCAITTTGTGANGAFATGTDAYVSLTGGSIYATADGGHGVMATRGGVMTINNVNMTTLGKNSGVIATDRGGGTIVVTGGTILASGQDSPGIYSTGMIAVTGATISATGAEAAVIEGANSIVLTNTTLSSSKADKWGVMIYQSFSGDAEGAQGRFTMQGGSLANTATSGPLFYVTNSSGYIALNGANVAVGSGVLLKASGNDRWGTTGANGGTAYLTATAQALTGSLVVDEISSLTTTLKSNSALTGTINSAATGKWVLVTLDSSSRWNVTADAHVTCLVASGGLSMTSGTINNLIGNGHSIYYNATQCPGLSSQIYPLTSGGYLRPEGSVSYSYYSYLPIVAKP